MDFNKITHSALVRFAQAVDTVMAAEDLASGERLALIDHWAYRCTQQDALSGLAAAIQRCQAPPETLMVTATSMICPITGEVVAFNLED